MYHFKEVDGSGGRKPGSEIDVRIWSFLSLRCTARGLGPNLMLKDLGLHCPVAQDQTFRSEGEMITSGIA